MVLHTLTLEQLGGGINFIDVGASGRLDTYWHDLAGFLNLYAFDPNKEECSRLSGMKNDFASATYLPYAIAGSTGSYPLYKTKNKYCWSLLKPNNERQKRFVYGDYFEVESVDSIIAQSLGEIDELIGLDCDVLKIDTQGLELAILKSSPQFIRSVFAIDVETGFAENYSGETRFHQIAEFLESEGFLLFGLNAEHHVPRNNKFKYRSRMQEITWAESMWLKDYVAAEQKGELVIDRKKALKALLLCANHGCIDYGYELAECFNRSKLLTDKEVASFKYNSAWVFTKKTNLGKKSKHILSNILSMLPKNILISTKEICSDASRIPNPLKRIFVKGM